MIIVIIGLPVALVMGITYLGCLWCSDSRIRPSVWVAIISTFVGSAIVGLFGASMEQGTSIWEQDGKTGLYWLPAWMGLTALVTFLPAAVVVFLYQRKMRR